MGQVDGSTSAMTQLLTQVQYQYSDQTVTANGKDDGGTNFQSLMEQKSKVASNSSTTSKETGKTDKKATAQQSTEQTEEDPIAREIACAEMVIADSVVMIDPQEMDVIAPVAQQVTSVADLTEQTAEPVVTAEPEQPEVQAQAVQTAETLPETQEAAQPTTKLESHTEASQAQPEQTEAEAPEAQLIQDVPKAGQAEETTAQEDTFSAVDAQSKTDTDAGAVLDDDADENDSTVTVSDGGAVAQPIFRRVEADMVKVGEAEPAEESQQAEDVNQQIADQLTSSLENGQTKVEIKLSPSSLGNVTVEVTAQENGALHIALSAENSHTKALLEQHVAGLQDLVSSQSQRSVQVEVAQRQENHQGGLQSDDQSGRGGYQQQQHRQQSHDDESFLQKLRLGLLPLSVDAVES